MKRFASMLLSLVLCVSLAVPAWAAPAAEEETAAWQLYHMGLFQGTATDEAGFPIFHLEGIPTRAQGVVMLVRLLGQEEIAQAEEWTTPFQDVPDWAAPYVGYAYTNGLTQGKSEECFDPDSPMQAREYLTFVLRALKYDSEHDFAWDAPWNLSDELGITHGEYHADTTTFDRGDVAWISQRALSAELKGTQKTLQEVLAEAGYIYQAGRCLWQEECVTSRKDTLVFSFTPAADSPEVYTSFQITKATANGLPCQIEGYETSEKVKGLCQKISQREGQTITLPDAFALAYLRFDQAKAEQAATKTVTAGGVTYPVITLQLRCTGKLEDGTQVEELVVLDYYIDGSAGLF